MADELVRGAGQTVEQMQMQLSALPRNRMYPKEEDGTKSKETLSELCRAGLAAVEQVFPETPAGQMQQVNRVDLADPRAIRDTAVKYLTACGETGRAPTFSQFCAVLGYSRKFVYQTLATKKNRGTEALSYFQSLFASIIEAGGLSRSLEAASSIFSLKNSGQGFSDRIDILAASSAADRNDPFESGDPEAIARKYLAGMAEPVNNNDYLEV